MRLHVNFKGCESVKRQRGGGGECTEMVGKWDGTCRKPRWSIYRYAQDVEQAVDESEDQVELKGRAFERGNIVNPGVLGRKNLCVRKCNLRRAWKRRKLWSNVTYTYKTVCTYLYMAYIYMYSRVTKIRDARFRWIFIHTTCQPHSIEFSPPESHSCFNLFNPS